MKIRPLQYVTILFFCILFLAGLSFNPVLAAEPPLIEPFERDDRVLVVAPHPDDDIIGCAGVIQRAISSGAKVKVVYTTCGDNNIFSIFFYTDRNSILFRNKLSYLIDLILSWKKHFINLGLIRMKEAIRAEKILGLEEKDLIFLGYPDHGTDQMFIYSWDHAKPFKESLGHYSAVPYEISESYKKIFTADNVVDDIKKIINDFKPTRIFVAHPSDVNGDHWASYLYTVTALDDLGDAITRPKIYPYLVHVPGWPLPRNYHKDLEITPPEKFFGESSSAIKWEQFRLTDEEIDKKYRAMLEHRSQMSVSAFYLLSFVRKNELFGDFPIIELKRQAASALPGKIVFTSDIRWVGYAVVDDSIWIKIKRPEEALGSVDFLLFFAGLRNDVPFRKMPNIFVAIDGNDFSVYNASEDKYLEADGVSFQIDNESLLLKVSLKALDSPQRLLVGFETDPDYIPDGCTAFRMIRID